MKDTRQPQMQKPNPRLLGVCGVPLGDMVAAPKVDPFEFPRGLKSSLKSVFAYRKQIIQVPQSGLERSVILKLA